MADPTYPNSPVSPHLIRAEEIATSQLEPKTHFLNPNARRTNLALGDRAGLSGIGVHLIKVEPGFETTEYHMHHHEDEAVYILDGEAIAVIGDETYPIGPGDFIGYPKGGTAHTIRNTGSKTLVCLVVGQRLPHDVCDYPDRKKRLYRNVAMPWNLVDLDAVEMLDR